MNTKQNESIRLLRDVDAYVIQSRDEVKLLAGNLVKITQSLGEKLLMKGDRRTNHPL